MEKLWREFPRIHFHSCPFVKFGSKIKSVSISAHPWLNCAVLLGNGKSRTGFPERLGCRSSIFGHSVFKPEEHITLWRRIGDAVVDDRAEIIAPRRRGEIGVGLQCPSGDCLIPRYNCLA